LPAVEHAGLVWTSLDPTPGTAPIVSEINQYAHRLHVGEPAQWQANAARCIENFADVAHFSILHDDAFGDPEQPAVTAIHVREEPPGVLRFAYDYPARVIHRDGSTERMVDKLDYEVIAPFTGIIHGAVGTGTTLLLAVCPLAVDRSRVFYTFVFDERSVAYDPEQFDAEEFDDLQRRIWAADRRTVESQRPHLVPLDLLAELHLPFDRFAIAYRRLLRRLGFDDFTAPIPSEEVALCVRSS
jgi:vanillate O-demethylase monooxygenase subunit